MLFVLIIILSSLSYLFAKKKIIFLVNNYRMKPRSQPIYYGIYFGGINFFLSSFFILAIYFYEFMGNKANYTYGYLLILALFSIQTIYIYASLRGNFRAHETCEKIFRWLLYFAAFISVIITIAILFTILFEAIKFFKIIPIEDFIFGIKWSPQSNNHQSELIFGVVPVLTGTILITVIAMVIALPIGLFSAIFLAEYVSKSTRNRIKPIIEILAGIPTVVYGYFAVLIVGPFIRFLGEKLGLVVSTESALSAGIVMGIMIIPFILSLSEDAINAVSQTLRDAALALGSTKAETIVKVVLPAASAGIMSSVLLAVSRAIGETMIVTMAAGVSAKLTFNPLESVTTFTAQIVALLVGDQEFGSPKTMSAFALAITLFIITMIFNIWAMIIIKTSEKKSI